MSGRSGKRVARPNAATRPVRYPAHSTRSLLPILFWYYSRNNAIGLGSSVNLSFGVSLISVSRGGERGERERRRQGEGERVCVCSQRSTGGGRDPITLFCKCRRAPRNVYFGVGYYWVVEVEEGPGNMQSREGCGLGAAVCHSSPRQQRKTTMPTMPTTLTTLTTSAIK